MMAHRLESHTISLDELLPEIDMPAAIAKASVLGLSIDSRKIQPGYLFAAVDGVRVHGKQFAEQAAANGALAVLIDNEEELPLINIPTLRIPDLQKKLSHIAGRFYQHPSRAVPVVGVTGTNGKTTCCQLLGQAYSRLQQTPGVIGTLGYGVMSMALNDEPKVQEAPLVFTGMTTADAIHTQFICDQLLTDGASTIVMEVSSHGMEQYRVADIEINTAVFTNLSHDHLDYHGSMEAYGQAKAKLFLMPSVQVAVINQDDEFSSTLINTLDDGINLLTYSLGGESQFLQSKAHLRLSDIHFNSRGATAALIVVDGGEKKTVNIHTQLIGSFNLRNLLAVIAVLYADGYGLKTIEEIVSELRPVVGRMELVPNALNIQVVVDYAHTPDALANALQALKPHCQGQLWCVFGCGGDRDREKRPEMAAIAEGLADRIIVTSDNPRTESQANIFQDIQAGFSQNHPCIANRADAIETVLAQAQSDDVILIAGKGHEDYQIIGHQKFPFSDQQHARLVLRAIERQGVRRD